MNLDEVPIFQIEQLGLGDVIDRNIPSQVTIEGHTAINVACGWWHTLVLAEPNQ